MNKYNANPCQISDGSIIDRADVNFRLAEAKDNPNILRGYDGTVYVRQENGELRVYGKKSKRPRSERRIKKNVE